MIKNTCLCNNKNREISKSKNSIDKTVENLIFSFIISYIYDERFRKLKMAYSKKEEFTKDDLWLADVAKALSHPARIRILKILSEMNVCMCGDIVGLMPLSQSTVSQHLKELKKVDLIQGEIEGPRVCYCVNNKVLNKAKKELDKLFMAVCDC